MKSLIVFDLDGTLLHSNKHVSTRNMQAIVNCYENGSRIAIATARPPRSVRRFLPDKIHDIAAFVYYNGGLICDEKIDFEKHIPISREVSSEILEYCSIHMPSCKISIEVKDRWYANQEILDESLYNLNLTPEILDTKQLKTYSPTKILITEFSDLQVISQFEKKAKITVTDKGRLIQIMHSDVSKGTGIMTLCNHLGIAPSETIVFGDDYNDIEMFNMSGYSVAMGNAEEELKQIADEIAETNDNDGVAKVLERILSKA